MNRCRRAVLIGTILALAVRQGAAAVPGAVLERHVTIAGQLTRVSLFDNRMAVVTATVGDQQIFYRRIRLDPVEYGVYERLFTEVVATARSSSEEDMRAHGVSAVIRLSIPGHQPRVIDYSPIATLDLETARLVAAVDDLEARVSNASPSAILLEGWVPQRGQRVKLFTGDTAVVDEVREDGIIVLEHENSALLEVVPVDARAQVISDLIEDEE